MKNKMENRGTASLKSLQNIIGAPVWEGRPAMGPFLMDWMSLFLVFCGALLALVAAHGVWDWWERTAMVQQWGREAILQVVLGPLALAVLFFLAFAIPGQLIRANRRALGRLRYVMGDRGVSLGMDEKSFNLPVEKIRSVRLKRNPLVKSWVSAEVETDHDWKASGVFHAINETFPQSRVTDKPVFYFIPSSVADGFTELARGEKR